jgi:hypothetical protein
VLGDEIVGVVVTQIMRYDIDNPIATWAEATDNGFLEKTHDPEGDTGYGVNLSVPPRLAGEGIGEMLTMKGIEKIAIGRALKRGVLGGRMPGYHEVASEMTPDEYMRATRGDGQLTDPELRFYKRAGMRIDRVLPGYMPEDADSCGHGVLLVWDNPGLTE